MRSKLQQASMIAVAAMVITVLLSAAGAGAAAQDNEPAIIQTKSALEFISEPVVQRLSDEAEEGAGEQAGTADSISPQDDAGDLAQMVVAQPQPAELSRELNCLASAVYFEARGESLAGQLAVARVVVARAKSGQFPDNYCGVIFQAGQFSFVRGHAMPSIRKNSEGWHNAVAIAQIAHSGSWQSPTEGALFFHATRVSPDWRRTRIARVDNHVFYR